jgi:hypothetical protein
LCDSLPFQYGVEFLLGYVADIRKLGAHVCFQLRDKPEQKLVCYQFTSVPDPWHTGTDPDPRL